MKREDVDLCKAVEIVKDRDREITAATFLQAANAVDGMVVGGRAWNEKQEMAAEILGVISKGLREMADKTERGEC